MTGILAPTSLPFEFEVSDQYRVHWSSTLVIRPTGANAEGTWLYYYTLLVLGSPFLTVYLGSISLQLLDIIKYCLISGIRVS